MKGQNPTISITVNNIPANSAGQVLEAIQSALGNRTARYEQVYERPEFPTELGTLPEDQHELLDEIVENFPFDDIYLTPLLRFISDNYPEFQDAKGLIASWQEIGLAVIERRPPREATGHAYSVLILNTDHPDYPADPDDEDEAPEEEAVANESE